MQVETGKSGNNPNGTGGFKKGQSGNPSGRTKMPVEVREMLMAKAQDAAQVYVKFLNDGDPRVALKAAELLLDRAFGKAQVATDGISFDVPNNAGTSEGLLTLHAAILKGTALGVVPLSEARALSSLLETHRRLIETTDLEQRIRTLEMQRETVGQAGQSR